MVKFISQMKGGEKTRVIKVRLFSWISSSLRGKLVMKNAHFYNKMLFLGQLTQLHKYLSEPSLMAITEACGIVTEGFILSQP